jgi:hypothetical protein
MTGRLLQRIALYGLPFLSLFLMSLYAFFGITLSESERVRPILISEIAVMVASLIVSVLNVDQPRPQWSRAINRSCLILNIVFGLGALMVINGAFNGSIGPWGAQLSN